MSNHGIHSHTSRIDLWGHLHPLEEMFYWHEPMLCLDYIKRNNLPLTDGYSRNGKITGRGYLVPKNAAIVHCIEPPSYYFNAVDWHALRWTGTDREIGLYHGETCVKKMLEDGVLSSDNRKCQVTLLGRRKQYQGHGDCVIRKFANDGELIKNWWRRMEIKTELVESPYLFIQAWEHGHDPNLASDEDGKLIERIVPIRKAN